MAYLAQQDSAITATPASNGEQTAKLKEYQWRLLGGMKQKIKITTTN